MKRWLLAFAFCAGAVPARAQVAGDFGLGVVLGDPTGMTAKYWSDPSFAVDFGVGFSGDAAFYGDFLWHAWDILPPPKQGKFGLYAGLGPRLETQRDLVLGIRTMGGVCYEFAPRPIEIFLEAGPVFRLAPDRQVGADGGVGVRFYFAGPSGARATGRVK